MRLNIALKNVLVIAALLGASSAQARVCNWLGATAGGWADDANWSCSGGPGAVDDLVFGASAGNKVHLHNRATLTLVNSITINGCGYSISGTNTLAISASTPITVQCDTLGASNAIDINNLFFNSPPPIQILQQTASMAAGTVTFDLGLNNAVRWGGRLEFNQTQPGMTQPVIRVKLIESTPSPSNEISITGGRTVFPSANSYGGLTTVIAGELEVLNTASLGDSGTAANRTIVRSTGTLIKGVANYTGELLSLEDNLNAAGVPDPMLFAISNGNWGGAITIGGPVNAGLQPSGGFSSNGAINWSISGAISGAGDIEIGSKSAGASLTLTGANDYSGATRILNFARLVIGAQSERIPNTSVVDIASGGALAFLPQIASASETIAGLSGLGDIVFGDGQPAPKLFVNVLVGQSYDFGGTISDLSSGSIPVGITGPGTQIISGTVSTQAPFNLRNNAIFDVRGTLFPVVDLGNSAVLKTGSLGKVLGVQPFAGVITAARIQPGGSGSFGILEISGSSVLLHPNITADFDMAGNVPGVNHDQIKTAAGGLTVELADAQLMVNIVSDLSPGQSAVLIDADTINGTFNGFPEASLYPSGPAPIKYIVSYLGGKFTLTRPSATPGDYVWTGSIDSDWNTPMNWIPDGPPTSGSIVRFLSGPSITNIINVPTESMDYIEIEDGYSLTGSGLLTLTNGNPIRFIGATPAPTTIAVPMLLSAPTAVVSAVAIDPGLADLRLGSGLGTLDFSGNVQFDLSNNLPAETGTGFVILTPYLKDTIASSGTVTYQRLTGSLSHVVRLVTNTNYSGDTIINGPHLEVSAEDSTAPLGNSGAISQTMVNGASFIFNYSVGNQTIANESLSLNVFQSFSSALISYAPTMSVQTWMGGITVPEAASIASYGGRLRLNDGISGGGAVEFGGDSAIVLDAACSIGDITINPGTRLLLSNSDLIPDNSIVNLQGDAVFDLNGNQDTIGALTSASSQSLVDVSGNASTAGLLTTTGNGNFAGTIDGVPFSPRPNNSQTSPSPVPFGGNLGGGYRIISGNQILSGNNTFSEPAEVLGGTLDLRRTLRDVLIDGGTLRVSGLGVSVDSLATANASSTGTLELLSNLSVDTNALINAPITINSQVDADSPGKMTVVGDVNITGASLVLTPTGTPSSGYDLITASASLTGIFNGLPDNSIINTGGLDFRINYTTDKVTITRLLPPPPDVVVDTTLDPGDSSNCSLRKALKAITFGTTPVNSNCISGAGTGSNITFDPAVFSSPQTIALTMGEALPVEKSLRILGPGARLLTIDGLNSLQAFFVDDGIPSNYLDVEIDGLSIVNGFIQEPIASGGAIASEENLILGGVRIANSTATFVDAMPGFATGGAIAMGNSANLSIYDSLLDSNQVTTAVEDSFAKGGAIAMNGGILIIENSTLTNNAAIVTGTASGPAAPVATGGAIYLGASSNGQIRSSTLVNNSTSAFNASGIPGQFESLGGGIAATSAGLSIENSVLSNQTNGPARTDSPDIYTDFSANANYCYIATPSAAVTATNVVSGAPLLSALSNNGGATDTIAMTAGSSLIDAGDPGASLGPFDQRGPGFNRVFGPHVDVGAFELQMGALPTLAIGDVSISGDNASNPSLDFLVTLSAVSATDVSFTVNTSTTDAEASDYTAISGQVVTIPAGMTTATVSVLVAADTTVEPTETVVLTLSAPVGATISAAAGNGTISNDDQAVISISSLSSAPESANAPITISTSNPIEGLVTVTYAALDGTDPDPYRNATSGADFDATPASAMISSGSVAGSISVTEDSLVEAPEQFLVNLTGFAAPVGVNPDDISLSPTANSHTHTIVDNDVTNVSTTDANVVEGDSGASQLIFNVTLSTAAEAPVQVLVSTMDFGAHPADAADYAGLTNLSVGFAPGETLKTFSIEVVSDDIVEAHETLQVLLTDPAVPLATITTPSVIGTITNDDSAVLSVNSASVIEGNSGTTPMNFILSLSQPVQGAVSVSFTPNEGSATAPSDFDATPSIVTVPSFGLNAGRSVPIVGDTVFEDDETFTVTLGNLTLPAGVTAVSLNTDAGIGTILNDDVAGGTTSTVFTTALPNEPFTAGIIYPVAVAISAATRPTGSVIVTALRQGMPELPPISCILNLVDGANANELVGSCDLSPSSPGIWVTSVYFSGTGGFSDSNASGNAIFTIALAPLTFAQSLNPTVVGQAFTVTVNANAAMGGPLPNGLVEVTQFPGGLTTSASMISGSATVNLFSRSPVVKGLLVKYTDSSGVYSAQDQFIEHVTNPAPTGISASLSATQGAANQSVVVTYTLGVVAPGMVPPGLPGPSGQVQVSDGVTSATCALAFPTGTCAISPTTLGVRQIVVRYLADASYLASTSPPQAYTVQQGGGSVDLMATIGNGVRIINGSQVVYTIEVRNLGNSTVGAASITNALPAGALSQSYTCIAAVGSRCGAASGTGAISQTIDIAPSGSVAYRVVVELPDGESVISNSVTVATPTGIVDTNLTNNTAIDIDPRGIIGIGFETEVE